MTRLLPDVGDELLLSVPQTEQVLVRVTAAGPGFFDLDLLELPATPQPQLERSALMIEFINDDGIARMHGRLDVPAHRRGAARGHGSGWSEQNTVRFAHRGSPQLLKRREYVRATVDLALTLHGAHADDDPVTMQAHAIDLSGGGMLVDGLQECPQADDVLGFALDLGDGGEPVRGRGRVVRLETAKRVGLQFTEMEQPDRIRLMHLAFEMSREQRRRFA
jgi:PilZ domain